MTVSLYTTGLDLIGGTSPSWTSVTYKLLLLKSTGYTFSSDHQFVSSLTPGSNEVSAAGYSRQSVSTPTRTVNNLSANPASVILYGAANPNFGTISGGQTVTAMVLYLFVSTDANSKLIAYYPIASEDTASISPFIVPLAVNGLLQLGPA